MKNNHYTYKYILNAFLLLILTSCTAISPQTPAIKSDKFRLMWNDDPMTTMTIGWHQYQGKPTLHYGLTNKTKNTLTPQRTTNYRGMNNKFARLTALSPDSKYYFKVCTQSQCTETMYFKTAPDTDKAFTFIAGGDSRTIPEGRIRGNVLISKIRPLFIAHGGDYTDNGTTEQWYKWLTEWQQTKSYDGRMYPLLITHGNHENDDHLMMNKIFDVPNIDVYSKRKFNFLSLYTLNTELEPMVGYSDLKYRYKQWNPQTKWLKETLEKDKNKWKVVSYHRPLRPHRSSKQEGKLRYLEWAPLFYKYGVQLSIECDSHLVKYTEPLKPDLFGDEGFIVDNIRGTTYIGEGSWGAPTRVNDDDKSWTIESAKFWQFKLITAKPDRLDIRTVKFGDENVPYNAETVEEITQKQQNENPLVIPSNLDLWETKRGKVLTLTN